jgi:pyruvate ferredoxin oxidoreductase alpha subunit
MDRSRQRIREIEADFNQNFSKDYKDINTYHMEDAEYALLIMGSMTGTARVVAENLRRKGEKAGVISIRWFRPFPFERLAEILKGVRAVGVMDRAVTPGGASNPLFEDVASGLYGMKERPVLQSFVAGLGGRDVPTDEFEMMFNKTQEAARAGRAGPCIYVGLRE